MIKSRKKKSSILTLNEVAIVITDNDNVAVAKKDIIKGTLITYNGHEIQILETIPKGHRFSLVCINKNLFVTQYGYHFGSSKGIRKGQLINEHNINEYRPNYKVMVHQIFNKKTTPPVDRIDDSSVINKTFLGYKRNYGRMGTRNYYLIIPTSLCASDMAIKIANCIDSNVLLKKYKNLDGIVAAAHTEGCGCNDGEIIDRLLLTLKNTIIHPNVGGALIVDLGCEKTNRSVVSRYFQELAEYGKPIDYISIQELGGTRKSFGKGKSIVLSRLKWVNSIRRQEIPISYLVVGTECGASDSFSGITANPVIGLTVDKIIRAGGSAILSETPEMVGAEISLIKRMALREVAQKFIKGMDYYNRLANKLNVSMDGNFVPGNEKGGLVNLTLKSLGAVLKGGSTEIVDFVDYAERIEHQGLSIMNGPGNDLESMTGIVASGANIILFSTGMGTTEGNLIVPVIKLSTRTEIYKKMREDIDFNAGTLIDNNISLNDLSDKLLDMVIAIASGRKTWAEIWKKRSFQIWSAGKLSL